MKPDVSVMVRDDLALSDDSRVNEDSARPLSRDDGSMSSLAGRAYASDEVLSVEMGRRCADSTPSAMLARAEDVRVLLLYAVEVRRSLRAAYVAVDGTRNGSSSRSKLSRSDAGAASECVHVDRRSAALDPPSDTRTPD